MSKIFASNNLSVGGSGIKWNIKASAEAPTNETEGHLGDVIVVTDDSALVKKIKYIVNKNPESTDFVNNSITVYYDSLATRIVVNEISNFQCILQAKTQNVIVDGISYILDVYFYDEYTHTWVSMGSAYRDNIIINDFSGKTLNVDEVMISIFATLTETINVEDIVPKFIEISDQFDAIDFSGSIYLSTNLDTIMPSVFSRLTEALSINDTPIS